MLNETSTFANNSCVSTYTGKVYLNGGHRYALVTIDLIIMVLNIVTNSAIVFALVATGQTNNASLRLILYLSISDCCLGFITQPLYAIMLISFSNRSYCDYESVAEFFSIFLTHVSAYIIGLIAVDRYCRMKYLTRYSEIMKNSVVHFALVVIIFLSLAQAALYVIGTQLDFLAKAKKIAVAIDACMAILVLLVYMLTIRVVRMHRQNAVNRDLLKDVENTVTLIASKIMLAIIVFYIPYIIISMLHSSLNTKVRGEKQQWLNFMLFLGFLLTYCNAFTNAVIFLSFNKKSQEKLKALCCNKHYDAEDTIEISSADHGIVHTIA